jgi:hypothetical protein
VTAGRRSAMMRGRNAFVWHARVKPIGLPLATLAAARRVWRGQGILAAAASATAILAAVVLEAELEFEWRRSSWRRAGRGRRCW